MLQAKICGLSTPEGVTAALDGRADYLGFIFHPKSPRYLTPEAAGRLVDRARGRVKLVAVTVDPTDALLDELVRALRPDLIQLHGSEPPARVAEVRARTGAGVIKAVPVSSTDDLDRAQAYEGLVDHMMFDAKPPKDHHSPGGAGVKFDWTLTKGRRFERPWFLAGGLDRWNVAEAADASGAPMVDVSSGVERGAGLKDPALIAAFLDAVRRA